MEKQRSVVYMNEGQTKITLIGKWFHMTPEELESEYDQRLEDGDSFVVNINNVLCEVNENIVNRISKTE